MIQANRRVTYVARESMARKVADPLPVEPDAEELPGALLEAERHDQVIAVAATCVRADTRSTGFLVATAPAGGAGGS